MPFLTFSLPSLNVVFAWALVVFPSGHAERYEFKNMKWLILKLTIIVVLISFRVHAFEMARVSLKNMVIASDYIVIGIVKDRIKYHDATHYCKNRFLTTITIIEKIKMKDNRSTLEIGYCIDAIEEDPTFIVGEKCLVFINSGNGKVKNEVVQGYYGKLTINDNIIIPLGIIDYKDRSEIDIKKFVKHIRSAVERLK